MYVGEMWDNFKYGCQNVFFREGGSCGENVDMSSSRCLSVEEKNISIGDSAPRQQSSSFGENLNSSNNSTRRNQNAATEIPQIVEIGIDTDNDSCHPRNETYKRSLFLLTCSMG